MKFLIVTYDWPPFADSVGACQRMVYLSRFLKDRGHEVVVLAARGSQYGAVGLEEQCRDVETVFIRSLAQRARNRRVQTSAAVTGLGLGRLSSSILAWMKRGIRHFPLSYMALDLPAYFFASRTAISQGAPDAVILSGPPHGIFALAPLLKLTMRYRGLFVLDYRDGWNSQAAHRRSNAMARWIERQVEVRSVRSADLVTHAAPSFGRLFKEYFGFDLSNSWLMMNGWWSGPSESGSTSCHIESLGLSRTPGRFTIGYFGVATYGKQTYNDHSCLFDAIKPEESPGSSLQFVYYGGFEGASSLGPWAKHVDLRGVVPPSVARALMAHVDVLLLVHVDQSSGREVLAGKIFDYAKSKRPILCVAPLDSAMSGFVVQHGLGWAVDPSDTAGLNDLLANLGHLIDSFVPADEATLSSFSRYSQYESFLQKVIEISGESDVVLEKRVLTS